MTAARFGRRPAQPWHKGVAASSRYVTMRDGVPIAIDIMRPGDAAPGERFPTVLIMARYWRSFALRGLAPRNRAPIGPRDPIADFLVARGYAVVIVDSRGSGASGGSTPYPLNDDELRDYAEVVDWVTGQPWSDGNVGATGISYEGVTAELLPAAHPGATRVVIPQQVELDNYTDVFFPGGIFFEWFAKGWQHTNEALDRGRLPDEWGGRLASLFLKGVRPVDDDRDGSQLREAISSHAANADVAAYARAITYRDDPFGPSGVTLDDFSVSHYRDDIERSGAAIFSWGSWLDGATADTVIRRFTTYSNPQWGAIGAWSHRYLNHASPFAPSKKLRPPRDEAWQELTAYFDHYLKRPADGSADLHDERRLYYYTMGQEAWKMTATWPPEGVRSERWYFADAHVLSPEAPSQPAGADDYEINFEATTGKANRWRAMDGVTKVHYPNRAKADRRLLTYTSAPLTEDVEVTGYPIVTLYVRSTDSDGAFFVYLEDVDERGRVTYVTEGLLRALHRKVSADEPSLTLHVPHHSFRRADGQPLIPGEVAELRFGMLPTSALIQKGHRLRIAIAGHDSDSFARIPATGDPVITVERNSVYPSGVELPVIRRTGG